jgi:N-acetylglucosaminyl-diphospho-decaprenol L-rhamnosyltransferase
MIEAPQSKVAAIVVTFNSAAVIGRCLASLPPGLAVTIVDNDSVDDTLAVARATWPDARLLRLPRNIGFGAAANRGLAAGDTPYALLLNPDAALAAGAVAALVAAAERYPDAGLLAPCCRDRAGRIEFRRRTAYARFLTNPDDAPVQPDGDCCAPYVGASVLLLRRAALAAIGGFDERIFLYGEDDDLCLRLSAAGWSLIHVADARADHLGDASTAPLAGLGWWKRWHMQWSSLYLARKHGGAGVLAPWRALVATSVKAAAYALLADRGRAERYGAAASASLAFALGREAQGIGIDLPCRGRQALVARDRPPSSVSMPQPMLSATPPNRPASGAP